MINIEGIQPLVGPNPVEPVSPMAAGQGVVRPAEVSDVVEISQAAALAARVQDVPEVRAELVEQVRAELAAGTYETPEKLEIAIDRLIEEVFPHLL